jgi:large subunit ribosomal protein L15
LARGLVPKKAKVIKVLGDGNLDKKLSIKVHRVSEKAREKIEAAGGSIELLDSKAAGGDA